MKRIFPFFIWLWPASALIGATTAELKNLSINGGVEEGKARLIIEANLNGLPESQEKPIFSTSLIDRVRILPNEVQQTVTATMDFLQGTPGELVFGLAGEGEIRSVTASELRDWSIRQETNGTRTLVLRVNKADKRASQMVVTITAGQTNTTFPRSFTPLALSAPQPSLMSGYIEIEPSPEISVEPRNPTGLLPIDPRFFPSLPGEERGLAAGEPLAFRFQGSAYLLPLTVRLKDPEQGQVALRDIDLQGELKGKAIAFTLNGTAVVKNPSGGRLRVLSGKAALTAFEEHAEGRIIFERDQYLLVFDRAGEFPIHLKFTAAVRPSGAFGPGWNAVNFRLARGAMQRMRLKGFAADTQFQFPEGARPEPNAGEFVTVLPSDGSVALSWKQGRVDTEGKLFFSTEMLSQITVSPGLMRQTALLDFKVMQGELNRITLRLDGEGEVTRVQGDQVLSWNVAPVPQSRSRQITIQLNQAQKDHFAVQIQMQTPLGTFPATVSAMKLRPEFATRFAGYLRIVNEGAVRLEIAESAGLSQISPEQFPETEATRSVLKPTGSQRFAFRFSGADYSLQIRADQILPELGVSEILAYQLAQNELSIDAELELDIRDAPLRELVLRIPKGFALARLNASGLSDYFVRDPEGETNSELRLVYGQPLTGRQLVQLRLERNKPLTENLWTLPRIDVPRAKSLRGQIAVAADAGFRLTAERTEGLTEVATAFFPAKILGIQTAYRLSEALWFGSFRVLRLPQTIQADCFHLFSIGEGIAYGSSVINYVISGAPVAEFRLELSPEYFNVEFTGKDIRGWQKTNGVYLVQLHAPVSGAFTLLATYERPFKAQGETLAFTGVRPTNVQTEQGHTVIISAYQFEVKPVDVSSNLLALEAGEVPSEYRLFFDAPILAAYRYSARPFNLKLSLHPLAQGESVSQIVDRASLVTHISREGQVITEATYFVKNRGNPHLRLTLPPGAQLWSATVDDASVVPVADGASSLIPLPQRTDPNAILKIDLKVAARSNNARHLKVSAPNVNAPVLLAQWNLLPDTRQRLEYRSGTVMPIAGILDRSGFAGLKRTFRSSESGNAFASLIIALALLVLSMVILRQALQWNRSGSRLALPFSVLSLVCFLFSILAFTHLAILASHENQAPTTDIAVVAPVQLASGTMNVEVANLGESPTIPELLSFSWPLLLIIGAWTFARRAAVPANRRRAWLLGWLVLAWATMRIPNGAPFLFGVIAAFLVVEFGFPIINALRLLRRQVEPPLQSAPAAGPGPATAAILVFGLFLATAGNHAIAAQTTKARATGESPAAAFTVDESPIAASVMQEIRVEEKFAFGTARIHWDARKAQSLPVLFDPAVLTSVVFPGSALKLITGTVSNQPVQQLFARDPGSFDIELHYQLSVTNRDAESGVILPVPYGLINQLVLTVSNRDVDVVSSQAVSVQRELRGSNTVATLTLYPTNHAWIAWRPRSRNVTGEKPVFYAEIAQLYVPVSGVVEGAHLVSIRPAQGELNELSFSVPAGSTISDVFAVSPSGHFRTNTFVSSWRFDPDARKLRVKLSPPQSRPFAIAIRSQAATKTLPFEQQLGLLSIDNAAGQIGTLGIATGNDVSLDSLAAPDLAPINLEDFPTNVISLAESQLSGLTLRRAFRYSQPSEAITLKASAVEPDVRVEARDTLSLGEDRIVLASEANINITRAGIFRLSFILPPGFDVESITSPALSHWTESKIAEGRLITLNLKGKTIGQQQLAVTLSAPGLKPTNSWQVPRLLVREASKQRGTLLVVPEQGLRLQAHASDGLSQLDPEKAGIRQKGVLAFNILQTPWKLNLGVEQVDPWIQANGLQHATVLEAQLKVLANLQYQIENAGVKSLRVFLPTNAQNVRFTGDQISDFLKVPGLVTNGLEQWEIKLHRRIIGAYSLQATYQIVRPENAAETVLEGIIASGVNLQRGFVTIQSAGRVQLRIEHLPESLQPAEWQSIPRVLQKDLQSASADFAFRLVEPAFQLALKLEHHEAAQLLPARVNAVSLSSVLSDGGVMLMRARLEIIPGDKRLLNLTLPKNAQFWFAFVNQNGVWPWREQDRILIPLEQQSRGGASVPVEIFYSCPAGQGNGRHLDLDLYAPKFDLPLENVSWRLSLSDRWKIKHWSGTLQLAGEERLGPFADLQAYLNHEATVQKERTREAEQFMAVANTALEQGDPQSARRAFQTAYGLSTHDAAFNEDARVQLHNLKLQEALVGLSLRQGANPGSSTACSLPTRLREQLGKRRVAYSQQDAKDLIDARNADENSAYMKLAERIVQQQDAAVTAPAPIRAELPEQGRVLTFTRAVVIDPWANLEIRLKASVARLVPFGMKFMMLAAVAGFLYVCASLRRSLTPRLS